MKEQRKEWAKPQLIILARGTSDENVLEKCKLIELGVSGPEIPSQTSCNLTGAVMCRNCQARSGS